MLKRSGWLWAIAVAVLLFAAAPAFAAQSPRLLRDINPGAESQDINGGIDEFAKAGHFVFFSADDGKRGYELWRTNGSRRGTQLVRDINPGPGGSESYDLRSLHGTLLFAADDGKHGYELWRSDGTRRGTRIVRNLGPGAADPYVIARSHGALYLGADDGTHGTELWKTDGTRRGTKLVRDIAQGPSDSFPDTGVRLGTKIFFAARDATHGFELWRSDGTRSGTRLVRNIAAGATGSNPAQLRAVAGRIFLYADDVTHGYELWGSDGTKAGTAMIADINPLPAEGSQESFDTFFFVGFGRVGDSVLFSADDGTNGEELWTSDGTEAKLIGDINPTGDSVPRGWATVNGFAYFSAYDGDGVGEHGVELWRSNGTIGGTDLVRDIAPLNNSSFPGDFAAFDHKVYFEARARGGNDAELWRSNGTTPGTKLAKEFFPGLEGGFPKSLTRIGDTLYLSARDDVFGAEPWTLAEGR